MMAHCHPCHLLHLLFVAENVVAPLVVVRMPLAVTLASEGDLGLVVSMGAQLSRAARAGAVATLALVMVGALTQLAAAGQRCPPDSQ